ncbi:MAG: hypothetical protein LIO49_01730 [Ruminococcus sp.]|nr:hypothetical protein [Ruminococcus sp.]
MKKLRKIVSLLLAVVMMMSLCVVVTADTVQTKDTEKGGSGTIYISDVTEGATYAVYKMLDLTYDSTTGSYTYTIASGWYEFFNSTYYDTTNNVKYVDITEVTVGNETVYYVTWNTDEVPVDTDTMQAFAAAAKSYATSNNISAISSDIVGSGYDALQFINLELGYYYVTSTVGSLIALNSTATTANIVDKNNKPTIEKYVAKKQHW